MAGRNVNIQCGCSAHPAPDLMIARQLATESNFSIVTFTADSEKLSTCKFDTAVMGGVNKKNLGC